MTDGTFLCRAPFATFVVRHDARTIRIAAKGEIDMTCERALDQVATHVESLLHVEPRRVVVDAVGISFCDAAAIPFLLRLETAARESAAEFCVSNPLSKVRRLLEIVGLTRVIDT